MKSRAIAESSAGRAEPADRASSPDSIPAENPAGSRRLKVLVSAYACNPYHGSEEGVGWGWVSAIARHHDLWVLTAAHHREDIERACANGPPHLQRVSFQYVEHKPWHYAPTPGWRFIEGSCLKPIMNYAYRLWQWDAYRLGRSLHDECHFDLVHQLTYVGFRFPGHLWRLDVPFVWGPTAGMANTPWRLLPIMGFRGAFYYAGRNIINAWHRRFLRGPRLAFRKAAGNVIAPTREVHDDLRRRYGSDSTIICEVGPPQERAESHSTRKPGEPLRLSWSGQHLPGKALPLLLGALARLPKGITWTLDVLGEGPCTSKWRRVAEELGLAPWCHWHGWVPRNDAVGLVHASHIFVITSLKDLTSSVLLEALSQGVPVVCPDHCGFRDVITDNCGIKVAATNREAIESDLADAIARLGNDESLRAKLAQGALARVPDFSWEKKAQMVSTIYRNAVAGKLGSVIGQ